MPGRFAPRSAAFMPLHFSHAPQSARTKKLSTVKRHECRAPAVLRALPNCIGSYPIKDRRDTVFYA